MKNNKGCAVLIYLKEIFNDWKSAIKLIAIGLITGIICGITGGYFHKLIDVASNFRTTNPSIIYLLPIAGLAIVFLYNIIKLNKDPGTNCIIEGVRSERKIPFTLAPGIFISTVITHLFGGSAGREGAALQLGGAIGSKTADLLKVNQKVKPLIILAGMSGVFSALFGTPLTAVIFVIELCCVGTVFYAALIPCFTASYIALRISILIGNHPVRLITDGVPTTNLNSVVASIIIGILCAALSFIFCFAMKYAHKLADKAFRNSYIRIFAGGVIIIVLTKLIGTYDYNGAGMNIIENAMQGEAYTFAFLIKILFTAITIGFGFKGGEIVPTFFIGATFGCVVGPLIGLSPAFSAALGMSALFAAVVNCPLASVVLACEIFGNNGILLYASAIFTAFAFSGYSSLYSKQIFSFSKNTFETLNRKSK